MEYQYAQLIFVTLAVDHNNVQQARSVWAQQQQQSQTIVCAGCQGEGREIKEGEGRILEIIDGTHSHDSVPKCEGTYPFHGEVCWGPCALSSGRLVGLIHLISLERL